MSQRVSSAIPNGEAPANMTTLVIGTDASHGSFVGASGFQAHHRSWGPMLSKIS